MRTVSTFVNRLITLAEPRLPPGRLDTINQIRGRRLDDALEDVVERACISGDLETASDVLGVLERMHDRRLRDFGGDRRINDERIRRLRQNLELRQHAKAHETARSRR